MNKQKNIPPVHGSPAPVGTAIMRADFLRNRDVRKLLALLILILGIAACGQKGGLYIPQEESVQPPTPEQTPQSSGK